MHHSAYIRTYVAICPLITLGAQYHNTPDTQSLYRYVLQIPSIHTVTYVHSQVHMHTHTQNKQTRIICLRIHIYIIFI